MIESEENEKFGYYFNPTITKIVLSCRHDIWYDILSADENSFHFILQSNGRYSKPMKFEIINFRDSGIQLFEESCKFLIKLGDIILFKEDHKICSNYYQKENYNYGIQNTLSDNPNRHQFTPKRILVIQMKNE